MIGIDSKHYPETLGHMFIINAPSIFSLAWPLITPFLDERTQRKIDVISSPEAWKKRLREFIDPESLPVEYGGTLVLPGGVFPPSRTQRTQIAAGKSFFETTAPVPAGASVRFKWFCRPGDMRFCVRFHAGAGAGASSSSGGSGGVEVYPTQTHPGSDKKAVIVSVTAPADGVFVATFDNVQGWYSRELFHRWDLVGGPAAAAAGGSGGAASAIDSGVRK